MELRQYQSEAVEHALAALARSGSAILQMPTGAGKTRTATAIVADYEGVVWFVCHRREIERQVMAAFTEAGIDFGLVSPRGKPDYSKRVQIISVATLAKRVGELPAPALVIWDECHHVAAKSWAAIREALTGALHLGLTATPERLDGKGLRDWFAELIVGPTIMDLIAGGHLSPFRYFAPSEPDLTAAKLQAGDYRKDDAAKIMNTPVLIGDALREYRDKAGGKRALAFCASVEASQALVARFIEEGIPAAHIDGTTPDDIRTDAVADLSAGRTFLLSNVEVFTEGVDIPAIDAVILLRPTRSVTLMLQMIGRALRVADGKDEAVILDHAGLWQERGLISDPWHWSLDGGAAAARREAGMRGPRKCPECKEVRGERVEVCACGFEFPAGREIGEYDGVLREIGGAVPEGCESLSDCDRRFGRPKGTTWQWVRRGMPSINGFPISDSAAEWVSENVDDDRLAGDLSIEDFATLWGVPYALVTLWKGRGCPSRGKWMIVDQANDWVTTNAVVGRQRAGLVTTEEFARHHVVTGSLVGIWRKRGMPSVGSRIPVAEANEWVIANKNSLNRKIVSASDQRLTANAFAKRIGTSSTLVRKWMLEGLPMTGDFIDAPLAEKWVKAKSPVRQNRTPYSPKEGFLNKLAFARKYGANGPRVNTWVKHGLPIDQGVIPIAAGDQWVSENRDIVDAGFLQAARQNPPKGYVTVKFLAGLLGRTGAGLKYHIRRGLPYDPKLGIPIQQGLEWVRDNRPDITIPPEAWPSANDNDNAASDKADAA